MIDHGLKTIIASAKAVEIERLSMDSQGSRQAILASVRSPLGFFTLIALIADGVLGGGTLTGKVPWWAPVGLLLVVLGLFWLVVFFRPAALYAPSPKTPVTVSLVFPPAIRVQLDIEKCSLEVRDSEGRPREPKTRPANLTQDVFKIWSIRLGSDVQPEDSVRLELLEVGGQRWTVNPFLPYVTSQQPVRVATRPRQ